MEKHGLEWMLALSEGADALTSAIAIAAFVFEALALYTIAKRRGIQKPWLSWIPVVNVWILGSISDQYRYVTKREVRNKRKLLLGLNIAVASIGAVILAIFAWIVLQLVFMSGVAMSALVNAFSSGQIEPLLPMLEQMLLPMVLILLLSLPLLVLAVVQTVYYWIAMYDVFLSCDPANAVVYLIASIVGGFMIEGVQCIFLMICRNKELGMPPRKDQVIEEAQPLPENDDN